MSFTTPYSGGDLFVGIVFGLIALMCFAYWWRAEPERTVFLAAAAVKLLASFLYGLVHVYYYDGICDSLGYHEAGTDYAAMIRYDLLHGTENYLSADRFFWMNGNSTTRFESLCGPVHFVLFDSFLACSFFYALIGLVGQVYLYRVFIVHYPHPYLRRWWQAGLLFFPTLVFWSSGMLKDAMGIYGLGCTVWAAHCLMTRRSYGNLPLLVFGAYVVLLYRAQILPVLFLALLAWLLLPPRAEGGLTIWRLSNLQRILLLVFGLIVVAGITLVDSQNALSELPSQIEHQQRAMANLEGGSNLEAVAPGSSSWLGLIATSPLSLVTTLYRPFPWEAHGVAALFGALENLVLLLLTLRAVLRLLQTGARFRSILQEPLIPTCLVFLVLFGVGIGSATSNLGTVSRYRIPLIPFFAALLIILEWHVLCIRSRPPSPRRVALSLPPMRSATLKSWPQPLQEEAAR